MTGLTRAGPRGAVVTTEAVGAIGPIFGVCVATRYFAAGSAGRRRVSPIWTGTIIRGTGRAWAWAWLRIFTTGRIRQGITGSLTGVGWGSRVMVAPAGVERKSTGRPAARAGGRAMIRGAAGVSADRIRPDWVWTRIGCQRT